jgi:hypothetical protein
MSEQKTLVNSWYECDPLKAVCTAPPQMFTGKGAVRFIFFPKKMEGF